MNIFEIATKERFRFPYKGNISVEDLWQLSVENLDEIFKELNLQAKQAIEDSLLNKKSVDEEILDTKIEIVKYIVKVKLDEENNRLLAKTKREQKQKIMAIMAEKQDSDLKNKSIDELQSMLNSLE